MIDHSINTSLEGTSFRIHLHSIHRLLFLTYVQSFLNYYNSLFTDLIPSIVTPTDNQQLGRPSKLD